MKTRSELNEIVKNYVNPVKSGDELASEDKELFIGWLRDNCSMLTSYINHDDVLLAFDLVVNDYKYGDAVIQEMLSNKIEELCKIEGVIDVRVDLGRIIIGQETEVEDDYFDEVSVKIQKKCKYLFNIVPDPDCSELGNWEIQIIEY